MFRTWSCRQDWNKIEHSRVTLSGHVELSEEVLYQANGVAQYSAIQGLVQPD